MLQTDIDPDAIGIMKRGRFCPFSPSEIKRHDPQPGSFSSGTRFLNVTGAQAVEIFRSGLCDWLPKDAVWDAEIGSLIHVSWWYRRYPAQLHRLSEREIDRLGLREFRDSLAYQG